MVFSVTVLRAGPVGCPFSFLELEFIFCPLKNVKAVALYGERPVAQELRAMRRPLSAPNNGNNSRNGRGGNRTRVVAVECGIGQRRHRERARVALGAEERGPKLSLKVNGQDFESTTDTMAAASVANENFFARLNAASKRGWWGRVFTADASKNKNRRAAIAPATVPRRVVAADRFSEM